MTGHKDDGWDGTEERRSEIPISCRRNCMEHSGIETKVDNLDKKLTVVLADHDSNQRLSERVSMLMWVLGACLTSIIIGSIYIFTTTSKHQIQYLEDQKIIMSKIEQFQKETINAIEVSSELNKQEINELQKVSTRDLSTIKNSFDETARELRKRLTVLETIQRVQEYQGEQIKSIQKKVEATNQTSSD
jgi:hypothetical protein